MLKGGFNTITIFDEMIYKIKKAIFKTKGIIFEIINNKSWKKFKYYITPNSFKRILIEKHLKELSEFPIAISIEVTNYCNARCWFCPHPFLKRKKGFMDFSLYKRIMNEINLNKKNIKSIALFMDGEPTTNKNLIKFLKYAKDIGVKKINLSSNMELFTKDLTNKVLDLGDTLEYLVCSLDGEKNRIGIDSKKAIENTEYLINQKELKKKIYPRIFTRFLISDMTEEKVPIFKKYWKGKADKVLCTEMHNWGGKVDETKLKIKKGDFIPCYSPFSHLAIQHDGTVRLCCMDMEGSVIIGDLKKQSIKEIWNNKKFKEIRQSHLNKFGVPKLCEKCSYPRKRSWTVPFFWK